jgi:hypothetical protein
MIAFYSDFIYFAPFALYTTEWHSDITLLSHPNLFLKHLILPILKISFCHHLSYGTERLHLMAQFLSSALQKFMEHRTVDPESFLKTRIHVFEHCTELLNLLNRLFKHSSEHKLTVQLNDSEAFMIVLPPFFRQSLVHWFLQFPSIQNLNYFLLPLIQYLVTLEANWIECRNLLLSAFYGEEIFFPGMPDFDGSFGKT